MMKIKPFTVIKNKICNFSIEDKIYKSPLTVQDGRSVAFIHNPKVAGNSLKKLLGIGDELSHHIKPKDMFDEKTWKRYFIIVAIRNPFERFLSGYNYHVKSDYYGRLYRIYGESLKKLNKLEYLHLIQNHPNHLGPQCDYIYFPSPDKPFADLILRYEHIHDWIKILKHNSIAPFEENVPQLNTSSNRVDIKNFNKNEFKKVYNYYIKDFQIFGYSIEQQNK